jgi:hypothetical protein
MDERAERNPTIKARNRSAFPNGRVFCGQVFCEKKAGPLWSAEMQSGRMQ